jgi:hypothetical protein
MMGSGSGMTGQMPAAHKPTLGYTVGIIVVVIIGYHFLFGKGRK